MWQENSLWIANLNFTTLKYFASKSQFFVLKKVFIFFILFHDTPNSLYNLR